MMREHLDGIGLANYLRMLRADSDKLFLVVEGDSDVRVLRRKTVSQQCDVIGGYGKRAVLKAMSVVVDDDPNGIVALVDRDFGPWLGEGLPENVFSTVMYDLEADFLLLAGILSSIVETLADDRRDDLAQQIIGLAASVGRLRWTSTKHGLNLRLREFPMSRVLLDDLTISPREMIEVAISRTEGCQLLPTDLLLLYRHSLPVDDDREVCSGHDLVNALAATSRQWSRVQRSSRGISEMIAVAIRCDILINLKWFNDLSEWALARGQEIWNC